jgi:hypothetical protein
MNMTLNKIEEYVKLMLRTNDAWALRALETIYNEQTPTEKDCAVAVVENNVGFNKIDAQILTDIAKEYVNIKRTYQKYGHSQKKVYVNALDYSKKEIVKRRIYKYWKQVVARCNQTKLVEQVQKYYNLV